MRDKGKKTPMKFKQAVEATLDIQRCYKMGLQGLDAHSSKIELSNPRDCDGSVNIDDCTVRLYPQSSRWDYLFAYKGEVFFVEVHSADTSEVSTVLRKFEWLKDWLTHKAPEINRLKAKNNPYYWIQSNGFKITKTSKQYRNISQKGLRPVSKLLL